MGTCMSEQDIKVSIKNTNHAMLKVEERKIKELTPEEQKHECHINGGSPVKAAASKFYRSNATFAAKHKSKRHKKVGVSCHQHRLHRRRNIIEPWTCMGAQVADGC